MLTSTQNLPSDVLGRIAEIVYYMQQRQYQRANDSYLRLSIGNAPWPIGVTMVGYEAQKYKDSATNRFLVVFTNVRLAKRYRQIRWRTY